MSVANELDPALLCYGALNVFKPNNSSPRLQMFISHIGQALVIYGCTPRRIQTGIEREFGRYTFSIKMPVDGRILSIIEKYPTGIGFDPIKENPKTLIIYENEYTKEVGIIEIGRYHCEHQYFGFNYVVSDIAKTLHPGAYVAAGTILADSPTIDQDKNWRYGIESNVAMMSVPAIIEDGVVVRRGYLEQLKTKGFESRVGSFGKNYYPLNLYGDINNYKPFPDIGDHIRSDGLLYAFREYDELLGPLEMTPKALLSPDYMYDKLTFAKPYAKVIDVHVNHDVNGGFAPTPLSMTGQVNKYNTAARVYYSRILEEYKKIKDPLKISPAFHRLLVEALAYNNNPGNPTAQGKINYTYRRSSLDDYRVEIFFEYDVKPTVGFKITGCCGDKSIIVDVWDDEDMPIDKMGNRADIIMDGDSTIKRMNVARMYEQYINATSRDLSDAVRKKMNFDKTDNHQSQIRAIEKQPKSLELYKEVFQTLKRYYEIISPKMAAKVELLEKKDIDIRNHVNAVLKDGIYLWIPTDNPVGNVDIIQSLRKEFPIYMGPVKYRGRSGNMVETVSNVLIGSLYIMLLEKTGQEWSAVSSAKLQHFGIPAKLTNSDKYSAPARGNPVRILGESEVRLFCAAIGGDATAEILDQSNNPTSHKAIVASILRAAKPTNIKNVIDRKEFPRGKSRPLVYMNHILQCSGIEFTDGVKNVKKL